MTHMSQTKTKGYGKRGVSTLLLLALVVPLLTPASRPARAAASSELYFTPSSQPTTVNQDIVVNVVVDPHTNAVNAVELHIEFDVTKLRLDSLVDSSTFSLELAAASINNTNGTASIALGVPLENSSVTAITTVATLTFHTLATVSPTTLMIDDAASIVSADGESGDALMSVRNGTVTIGAEGSDTTAPVLSAGAPSGALSAGTTSTTVSLTTNEFATCKYATSTGVAYGSMTNTFSTTAGTTHSFSATSLSNGSSYTYSVRCQDGSNNANTDDYNISFSVASSASSNDDGGGSHKKKKVSPRKITNSVKSVHRGGTLTQRGKKFSKNSLVALYFSKPNGTYYPPMMVKTSGSGAFMIKYRVTKPAGKYSWYVVDTKTGKKSKVMTYTVK